MSELAIQIDHVARSFGTNRVLDGLSLHVPAGQTFAFLGRNGAGKSTTIRMMMGLIAPDSGTIRVLGLDPAATPLEVRRRVGYLAEDQATFGWMKVHEMISFIGAFYPTWDNDHANRLARQFELPLNTKCKVLSKGQSVRLGLLLALAHRPRLVILDDPTLGLDPIARRQFLSDIVTLLQGEGVTVFFSSHLLYEVEPIADRIAILDKGRIVLAAESEQLRHSVKQVILTVEEHQRAAHLPGVLHVERADRRVAVTVADYPAAQPMLAAAGLMPQVVDLNLDEIFQAYVAGRVDPSPAEGGGKVRVEVPV
jgi:ABC-2 type transport system ATP-binding protein